MNEVLRLQSINVKQMSIFDFISLLDCMEGVQYNVENLLLLLKALVCVDDFNHVSIMKIVYFVEKYGCSRKIDKETKRRRENFLILIGEGNHGLQSTKNQNHQMKMLLAHKRVIWKLADPRVRFSVPIHKPHRCPHQCHLQSHRHPTPTPNPVKYTHRLGLIDF